MIAQLLPELSNFGSPPVELVVYSGELTILVNQYKGTQDERFSAYGNIS
jgi:hypothetical protein